MSSFGREMRRSSFFLQSALAQHRIRDARTLVALVEIGGGIEAVLDDLFQGDAPTDDIMTEFGRLVELSRGFAVLERKAVENATDTDICVATENVDTNKDKDDQK